MSSKIHVVSENDLQGIKHSGRRVRAICPVHHGNERHLSIAAWSPEMDEEDKQLAGWGHCHSGNCGATVLVQEWNPRAAAHVLGHAIETHAPRIAISTEQREQAEEWQLAELAALDKIYPRIHAQLSHDRAQAYLKERGLQDMQALLASLGVGYIPALTEWNGIVPIQRDEKTVKVDLKKWTDRIIFPYTTREGKRGFIGRALAFWYPGMDENEHKQVLKTNEVVRWKKTYKSGYFHKEAMSQHKHLFICEGPFDAIPLLAAGIENTVASVGTELDALAIPASVRTVTLAFDADISRESGTAIARACEKLGYAGISFDFLPAPGDGKGKDWSERYRLHGIDGLAPLLATMQAPALEEEDAEKCAACGIAITDLAHEFHYLPTSDTEAVLYCDLHFPGYPEQVSAPVEAAELEPAQDDLSWFNAPVIIDGIRMLPPGYVLRIEEAVREQLESEQARISSIRDARRKRYAA